jgi:hypothetical protein
MRPLNVPVPATLTATYLVPMLTPVTAEEAQKQTVEAVDTRLTGIMRELTLHRIRQGAVTIGVAPVPDEVPLPDGMHGLTEVMATGAASIMAMPEWYARAAAVALALSLGVPLLDVQGHQTIDPHGALAALPDMRLADPATDDLSIGFSLRPWVGVRAFTDQGRHWAVSRGMRRFGLPEFMVGGCERDLREELTGILAGITWCVWSDLFKRAQSVPKSRGLLSMPRSVQIPAEVRFHRKDIDAAQGVPNRGGSWAEIGLRYQPAEDGNDWLAVCPTRLDIKYGCDGMEDFIANLCHVLFGFEKPRWHYLPGFGVISEAVRSVPEGRRRFTDGELPDDGQFMVRYLGADDEPRWGQVTSWQDDDVAIVRDIGPELAPMTRAADAVPIQARRIVDWAIWEDGKGVVEGATTEGVSGP